MKTSKLVRSVMYGSLLYIGSAFSIGAQDPEIVYLGVHGEIISPMEHSGPMVEKALTLVRTGNVIHLYNVTGGELVATITSDGKIKRSDVTPKDIPDLSEFPTSLTWDKDDEDLLFPSRGTVFSRNMHDIKNLPPTDSAGWAVQVFDGGAVFMPRQDTPKPANFLWIVSKSGFSLVHSGPKHNGVLVQVDQDYRLSYGSTAPIRLKNIEEPVHWPYRFYEGGREVPLSVGNTVDLGGIEDKRITFQYDDGILRLGF